MLLHSGNPDSVGSLCTALHITAVIHAVKNIAVAADICGNMKKMTTFSLQ
jgi:hypothetical protein